MFSGNNKISSRQAYRNYAAAFISLSALLPPLMMNQENTSSIVLALIFLGIFLAVTAAVPRPVSGIAKGLCYIHYWILGTMLVRMTGLMVQEFLLTDTALWMIVGWFCLFCYYNLYKGMECRLRVSEILFPFFLFFLLLLTLLMYGEIEGGRIRELRFAFNRDCLRAGYQLFCWLGAVQSLWHLQGQVAKEQNLQGTVRKVWLTGAVFTVGWSLFSYGIYGNRGNTGLVFPLASAMTLAHFPGNVIGRLDTLFVFAWVIGLFLLCSSLFAPLMDQEPDRRHKYLLFALLASSFACACSPECMEWGQKFLYYISTPVQILLLLFYSLGKKGKTMTAVGLCLVPLLLLTGCSAQELEQQSLVTAVGVDTGAEKAYCLTFGFGTASDEEGKEEKESSFETEADSLSEAEEIYWEYHQKNMDFNHLKNFYFSREILEEDSFARLLEEIQRNGAYSRGTLVHATEEEAAEYADQEEQPEEGMPLHRMLNAWYNQENCEIPSITEDGRYRGSVSWPY